MVNGKRIAFHVFLSSVKDSGIVVSNDCQNRHQVIRNNLPSSSSEKRKNTLPYFVNNSKKKNTLFRNEGRFECHDFNSSETHDKCEEQKTIADDFFDLWKHHGLWQSGFCDEFQIVPSKRHCRRHHLNSERKKKDWIGEMSAFLKNHHVQSEVFETAIELYRTTWFQTPHKQKHEILKNLFVRGSRFKKGIMIACVYQAYMSHNLPQDFPTLVQEFQVDFAKASQGLNLVNMLTKTPNQVMGNNCRNEMLIVLKLLKIQKPESKDEILSHFDQLLSIFSYLLDFASVRAFCVLVVRFSGFINDRNFKASCRICRVSPNAVQTMLCKLNPVIRQLVEASNNNPNVHRVPTEHGIP